MSVTCPVTPSWRSVRLTWARASASVFASTFTSTNQSAVVPTDDRVQTTAERIRFGGQRGGDSYRSYLIRSRDPFTWLGDPGFRAVAPGLRTRRPRPTAGPSLSPLPSWRRDGWGPAWGRLRNVSRAVGVEDAGAFSPERRPPPVKPARFSGSVPTSVFGCQRL